MHMHCENDNPLVSVVMGVRYHKKNTALLIRSIESILNQSYSNFEILICENESSLEAKKKLRDYSDIDKRLKLIDGTGADSLAAKLNRCIKNANGKYIARMDDDDYSLKERIAEQVAFLENNPSCSFVGSNVELTKNEKSAGNRVLPEWPVIDDFCFVQPFIHPTLIFRREVFDTVGYYSEVISTNGCEDYDLLLRIYEAGFRGANMQKNLLQYNISSQLERKRTIAMRINEVVTRWNHFQKLGWLPQKFIYVIKPLLVAMVPNSILIVMKKMVKIYES